MGFGGRSTEPFSEETGEHVMTIAEQIRVENTEQIALKMIDDGVAITTIVRWTELTMDKVVKLTQKHRRS